MACFKHTKYKLCGSSDGNHGGNDTWWSDFIAELDAGNPLQGEAKEVNGGQKVGVIGRTHPAVEKT